MVAKHSMDVKSYIVLCNECNRIDNVDMSSEKHCLKTM